MKFWLSFAAKEGSLGVVVVESTSQEAALLKANQLGLNPGGEVIIFPVPPEADDKDFAKFPLNRVLSLAELEALGARRQSTLTEEEQEILAFNKLVIDATTICECCNKPNHSGN